MNVLIACECSGIVRDAFIRKGHNAWSCDLQPGQGYYTNRHIQDDILNVLCRHPNRANGPGLTYSGYGYMLPNNLIVWPNYWNILIAHPDCQYLAASGLHWNKRIPGRQLKTDEALRFVRLLMDAPIHSICIENPVGCISTRIRPADQYIQPYEFGENASKKTGLWLKNLPPLKSTKYVFPRIVAGRPRWNNQTDSGQNRLTPSPTRTAERARTYPGIAQAMADQWG